MIRSFGLKRQALGRSRNGDIVLICDYWRSLKDIAHLCKSESSLALNIRIYRLHHDGHIHFENRPRSPARMPPVKRTHSGSRNLQEIHSPRGSRTRLEIRILVVHIHLGIHVGLGHTRRRLHMRLGARIRPWTRTGESHSHLGPDNRPCTYHQTCIHIETHTRHENHNHHHIHHICLEILHIRKQTRLFKS